MTALRDPEITNAIVLAYHEKLPSGIVSGVLTVGAGAAGMMGALHPRRDGLKATLPEKRPSPGGRMGSLPAMSQPHPNSRDLRRGGSP